MKITKLTAEDIAKLSPEELAAAQEEHKTEFVRITDAKQTEQPSVEEIADARLLAENLDLFDADVDRRATEAQAAEDELAALRERKFGEDRAEAEETEEVTEPTAEVEAEETEEEVVEEPAAEVVEEPAVEVTEPVAAAARQTSTTTAKARSKVVTMAQRKNAAKAKEDPFPGRQIAPVALTAAAGAPNQTAGSKLELLEMADAVIDQARMFSPPNGDGKSVNLQRYGTGKIEIQFPDDLMVDRIEDIASDQITAALDETQLPGGSLLASGGWCAPSETVYDLDIDSTTDGMVSLPEVGIRRGGLRYPVNPDFAAFYANPGFTQTEAQAISGTTKPCVEVDCPGFVEVRLDVEGLCIKVPILTNVGYPEYVSTFISGTMIAHQHWINANVIARLVAQSTALRDFTTGAGALGSAMSDTLAAVDLVILQRRQKHRLSLTQTIEVIFPFWAQEVFRNDLGRRNGRDKSAVSNGEIAAHFAAIGANVQYVYDWQLLDEDAEIYPATLRFLAYPAGTFVKGVQPVISLDTVYDAASLAVNTYTGLFTEQAFLVAKKKLGSDYAQVPVCMAGRTGAANLTCS